MKIETLTAGSVCVGLSVVCVAMPRWPLVVLALGVGLAFLVLSLLDVVLDRQGKVHKEALDKLESLSKAMCDAEREAEGRLAVLHADLEKLTNRLVVVENRTRPVGGGR